MAILKNGNGEKYVVLLSRPSKYKGRKDYLVRSESGCITIARGWKPECKCWVASDCYGWGDKALKDAKIAFKGDKNAYLHTHPCEKIVKSKKKHK